MIPFFSIRKKILALALMAAITTACAHSSSLRTTTLKLDPPDSKCRLILYTSYDGYVELRVAVIDLDGDGYELLPYAPEHSYKIVDGMRVTSALDEANAFLRKVDGVDGMKVLQVFAVDGTVIAYEARPLYGVMHYGYRDITDTNYYIKGEGTVKFVVRPIVSDPEHLENIRETP